VTPLFDFQFLGRRFASIADYLEIDVLALVECGKGRPLNPRDMNIHVLPTALRLKEAVTLMG
jgi:hypothetical protein